MITILLVYAAVAYLTMGVIALTGFLPRRERLKMFLAAPASLPWLIYCVSTINFKQPK